MESFISDLQTLDTSSLNRLLSGQLSDVLRIAITLDATTCSSDQTTRLHGIGVSLWNSAVKRKMASLATDNCANDGEIEIQAKLRIIGLFALSVSFEKDARSQLRLAVMNIKCSKTCLAANMFKDAERCLNMATHISSCLEFYADTMLEEMDSLEFNILINRSQLEWKKSPSLALFSLSQASQKNIVKSLQVHEIEEFVQICLKFAKTSDSQQDQISVCNTALDLMGEFVLVNPDLPVSTLDEAKLSVITVLSAALIQTKSFDDAEVFLDNNISGFPKSCTLLYYLKMKSISSRPQTQDRDNCLQKTFSDALRVEHDGSEKVMRVWMSMVYLIACSISYEKALFAVDQIMVRETTASSSAAMTPATADSVKEKMLVTKLFLVTSIDMNANKASQRVSSILDDYGKIQEESTLLRTCQHILWKAGDRAAQNQAWSDAISWYCSSLRLITSNLADRSNASHLHRKIALCYIRQMDFDNALTYCTNAADCEDIQSDLTLFLYFVIHMEQQGYSKAIDNAVKINSGKRLDLLISAAGLAYQKSQKDVLLRILQTVEASEDLDVSTEAVQKQMIVILRCLIRLLKANIQSERYKTDIQTKLESGRLILKYGQRAYNILSQTRENAIDASSFNAEVDWLFRSCWNCAVQLAKTDSSCCTCSCSLFELSGRISYLFPEQTVSHMHSRKTSFFVALVGKGQNNSDFVEQKECLNQLKSVLEEISTSDPQFKPNEDAVVSQSLVLEFKLSVNQKKWEALEQLLNKSKPMATQAMVVRKMADMVIHSASPSTVTLKVVEAFVELQLKDATAFDVKEFSIWQRILIQTGMSCKQDCSLYFEQAEAVIRSRLQQTNEYPQAEIKWLVICAWNIGCELWSHHNTEAGAKWAERSLSIAIFLDDESVMKKIRDSFSSLMRQNGK